MKTTTNNNFDNFYKHCTYIKYKTIEFHSILDSELHIQMLPKCRYQPWNIITNA